MFKKLTLGVLGLLLIGGLLFGGRIIPYTQTAIKQIKSSAQGSVPVEFQIDAAKDQLSKIGPEIKNMVHQVAKEKVQINRLAADLKASQQMIEKSYEEMMTLRDHVSSGDKVYVAINNKAYTTSRVEEDLRHRFSIYQTAELTMEKQLEILEIRQKSLDTAIAQLDESKAQQRELEVQIENLTARHRMNEVVATASHINIDNSQLAKTREMLDEIDILISANEEVLNIAPKYYGQIPVSTDSLVPATDILEEMDAYFDGKADSDVETDEEFVFNN